MKDIIKYESSDAVSEEELRSVSGNNKYQS